MEEEVSSDSEDLEADGGRWRDYVLAVMPGFLSS